MMGEAVPFKAVLEGGTDAASMLIFDPAALPENYDIRFRIDPMEIIESLFEAGEIYWLNTASDGGYNLGVILGVRLPEETAGSAKCLETAARFKIASGRLYFTGIEYAFRQDDSRLRKYPHMGAYCEIPPGVYRLTVYKMDYPEDFHQNLLRQRLPAVAYRLYLLIGLLIPLGFVGVIVLAVLPFVIGLRLWAISALPFGLAALGFALMLFRSKSVGEASRQAVAIHREYPDYWAIAQPASNEPI